MGLGRGTCDSHHTDPTWMLSGSPWTHLTNVGLDRDDERHTFLFSYDTERTQVHVHTPMPTHPHTTTHTCMHKHTHIHICTYSYTHVHSHLLWTLTTCTMVGTYTQDKGQPGEWRETHQSVQCPSCSSSLPHRDACTHLRGIRE